MSYIVLPCSNRLLDRPAAEQVPHRQPQQAIERAGVPVGPHHAARCLEQRAPLGHRALRGAAQHQLQHRQARGMGQRGDVGPHRGRHRDVGGLHLPGLLLALVAGAHQQRQHRGLALAGPLPAADARQRLALARQRTVLGRDGGRRAGSGGGRRR
ncbi:hypothetical protein C1702_16450, partial [Caldimonas thermodepolymerans]